MTDLITREEWQSYTDLIKDRFDHVFGKSVKIDLIYHEGDYADNSISIDGVLEIYLLDEVASKQQWQLSTVSYTPGSYYNPPDCHVNEVGEPHSLLENCIREAVKLYAEWLLGIYLDRLADEEQARFYELYEAAPHSWKP